MFEVCITVARLMYSIKHGSVTI